MLDVWDGADDGSRTRNLLITNQLLCQLSYVGKLLQLTRLSQPEQPFLGRTARGVDQWLFWLLNYNNIPY
jgi:hypothetical protein